MRAANSPALAYAKLPPRRLEKEARKAAVETRDRAERKICHLRSGGRCEVILVIHRSETSAILQKRCKGKARHNHHLQGGIGRRNVGDSILSECRIDVCPQCHGYIEDGIYEPYRQDESELAATVRYIEVRR